MNEPRNGLQFSLHDVLFERFQEDAEIRRRDFHAGKQVGYDALEQRHILPANQTTLKYFRVDQLMLLNTDCRN